MHTLLNSLFYQTYCCKNFIKVYIKHIVHFDHLLLEKLSKSLLNITIQYKKIAWKFKLLPSVWYSKKLVHALLIKLKCKQESWGIVKTWFHSGFHGMVVFIMLSEAKKAKIVYCYMWTLENGWRNLVLSHISPFVNLMSDNDNHDMYLSISNENMIFWCISTCILGLA